MVTLRDLRIRAGLSLLATGQALRVHLTTVQKWETGVRAVPVARIRDLAAVFAVDRAEILDALSGQKAAGSQAPAEQSQPDGNCKGAA